jgi:hypothetical protein
VRQKFVDPGALGRSLLYGAAVNLPWEMAHYSLYAVPDQRSWTQHLLCCALAALLDGGAVAAIYAVGSVLFRDPRWVSRPGFRGWLLVLTLGAIGAILTERLALALGWWRYGRGMPTVPGLNVGFSPLLQFLVLPPAVLFLGTGCWLRNRRSEPR